MDWKLEKTPNSFIGADKMTIKICLYLIICFILEHHTTSIVETRRRATAPLFLLFNKKIFLFVGGNRFYWSRHLVI